MTLDPKLRIVTQTPLTKIWNDSGELAAERIDDIGVEKIKSMFRQGSIQFVVANIGMPLDWINPNLTFDFWKKIAKERIVSPDVDGFSLNDYPGGYCFCAALWRIQDSYNIVVLETHH